ncbi:MAG: translocation and assembly module TamB, partial [Sphingomonadales bacterium]|nr:translocation and assembly module TamB [Sphingomonadales bacterium]
MDEAEAPPPPRRRRRWRWASRLAKGVTLLTLMLAFLVLAAAALLDTAPGHRFIADRIAAMAPHSGLRIRIGRIDGSIWSGTRLKEVRLYDPKGLFAESPELRVDWQPLAWLGNRLVIHDLEADV